MRATLKQDLLGLVDDRVAEPRKRHVNVGGVPDEEWTEYSPRRPKGLPDHTTHKSFAYEDLPLAPLTGYREIDLTIEDIHKAFVEGDAMGPQGPSN